MILYDDLPVDMIGTALMIFFFYNMGLWQADCRIEGVSIIDC